MKFLYRSLDQEVLQLLHRTLETPYESEKESQKVVAHIGDCSVPKWQVRELRAATSMSSGGINMICSLMRRRDQQIWQAHRDKYSSKAHYHEHFGSIYFDCTHTNALLANSSAFTHLWFNGSEKLLSQIEWPKVFRIYLPFQLREEFDSWKLGILDPKAKRLSIIDPGRGVSVNTQMDPHILRYLMRKIGHPLAEQIDGIDADLSQWTAEEFPHRYYQSISEDNTFDSALYVSTCMYMLSYGCPLAFAESDMNIFRQKFAYSVLNESLTL